MISGIGNVFLIENDKQKGAKRHVTEGGKAGRRNGLGRGCSYDSFSPRNDFVNSGLK
jgi:hypothetical protein